MCFEEDERDRVHYFIPSLICNWDLVGEIAREVLVFQLGVYI